MEIMETLLKVVPLVKFIIHKIIRMKYRFDAKFEIGRLTQDL
jgi:hypothetical protein